MMLGIALSKLVVRPAAKQAAASQATDRKRGSRDQGIVLS